MPRSRSALVSARPVNSKPAPRQCQRSGAALGNAAEANGAGMTALLRMAPGRDHFSMLEELRDPDGGLTQDLMALINST